VADAKTSSKQGGLTRGKAILIGLLSIALVVVLYVQFGGGGEELSGDAPGYRPPRPAMAVEPANSLEKPVTLASANATSNTQAAKDKDSVAAALVDETRWKPPKLATIVAYDPFALPASFPQPPKVAVGTRANGADGLIASAAADDAKKLAETVEKRHMQLEELRQRGVHVIVREGNEYVAVIGDRMLHVGDEIDGFTVTAINPEVGSVHVERKESP
jgi:hypothetical protein